MGPPGPLHLQAQDHPWAQDHPRAPPPSVGPTSPRGPHLHPWGPPPPTRPHLPPPMGSPPAAAAGTLWVRPDLLWVSPGSRGQSGSKAAAPLESLCPRVPTGTPSASWRLAMDAPACSRPRSGCGREEGAAWSRSGPALWWALADKPAGDKLAGDKLARGHLPVGQSHPPAALPRRPCPLPPWAARPVAEIFTGLGPSPKEDCDARSAGPRGGGASDPLPAQCGGRAGSPTGRAAA